MKNNSTTLLRPQKKLFFLLCMALVTFFVAVTQPFGESPDYYNYVMFFDSFPQHSDFSLAISRFEPGFVVLVWILIFFTTSNLVLYGTLATLSVILKGFLLRQLNLPLWIMLFLSLYYYVRYFPLHELTQLRAAFATGMALWAGYLIYNNKMLKGAIFLFVAPLFHLSAIAIAPLLFLKAESRLKIFSATVCAFFFLKYFTPVAVEYLSQLIPILKIYQERGFSDISPNLFSAHLLIDWLLIAGSLFFWQSLTSIMKRIVLLQIIGMCIFYSVSEFGVIVHRLREFISVFWILYLGESLKYSKYNFLSFPYIGISLVVFIYINFISGAIFEVWN